MKLLWKWVRFKRWCRKTFRLKWYPEYKMVNGIKVRFTGPMSVNRKDALRAHWSDIQKISKTLKR